MQAKEFLRRGWARFPRDPDILRWLAAAGPAAWQAVADPKHWKWLRCEDTWFAGVNILPNDPNGAVAGSGQLGGQAVNFLTEALGMADIAWDRGQVSVVYPGYPRPKEGESATAFRFRRDRDAAHVDGLHPGPAARSRILGETHRFILGLPLSDTGPAASPMVVWEGSHEVMRQAFLTALAGVDPERWGDVDLNPTYVAARREVFDNCPRVIMYARPGESYLIHRLALHGISPWVDGGTVPPEGRAIIYFRPALAGPVSGWLELD